MNPGTDGQTTIARISGNNYDSSHFHDLFNLSYKVQERGNLSEKHPLSFFRFQGITFVNK